MSDIQTTVQDMMIRYLVQYFIFCPVTGRVLDERTCLVILDSDGDPVRVLDPSTRPNLNPDDLEALGFSIMER